MFKTGRSNRSSTGVPDLADHPPDQGVHVFLFETPNGERFLSHTSGRISAEDLCISAAKAAGISPLYHVLFALYEPQSSCWYNPNHIFDAAENSCLVLLYRLRFYYRNWHEKHDKEPKVSRYDGKAQTDHVGKSLFENSALDYLFAQAKYEFVNELIYIEEFQSEEEQTTFKNESLGIAVLHLLHHSLKTGSPLKKMVNKMSFENCIPKSFAKQISMDNFFNQLRLRRVFKKYVQTLQKPDLGQYSCIDMINMYMFTLEHLAPSYGSETFSVSEPKFGRGEDGRISATEADLTEDFTATHEIMVSGNKGIHWRPASAQKRRTNGYLGKLKPKNKDQREVTPSSGTWTFYCDFPRLTHAVIDEARVLVFTEDNNYMEVLMSSSQEARSFISLLDGHYRLTADAHHHLCHDVAPPRVVLSEANRLHGPVREGLVLQKLRKMATEPGSFLLRWSTQNYELILITVLNKDETGTISCHRQFRIYFNGATFRLESCEREYSSIKELTDSLSNSVLKSGGENYTVKKCILPQPRELSNLLVMRNGLDIPAPTDSSKKQVRCQQMKSKDIKQEQHLGRGTRTNIYSGFLHTHDSEWISDRREDNNNSDRKRVVLKVLDQVHDNIALSFLETATLMNQVSHRHLVLVHGVAVKGSEDIMVEEFVEFGPLDVFLRNEKASVTSRWKLIVAQQLASALNYLESKQVVHGNVCARNILLARQGLEEGTSPFIKLSDPGIPVNNLTREERLERIPWIAPECIDSEASISGSADQWSFGVTLLELCNDGNLPMSSCKLLEKERFYQQKGRLTNPSSELADYINKCLTYEPSERPSFLFLQRKLSEIMRKNPDMTPSETFPDADPSQFHKRYLKLLKPIGEGHFGKVTLNMYDPANDNKGELVAVKSLKQENGQISQGWLKEIEILKSLYHSNIVKYKGFCTEMGGQVVQLIMEYLPLGSLQKYLHKEKLGEPQCLLFAQQICQGMNYLHSRRYVHRDLAARNVLVETENLVKIGDFGLSKYIPEGDAYYRQHSEGDSPVYWYAIECLKDNKFSFPSDIWSFGVTLHEIMNRCDPRQSPPILFNKMRGPSQGQPNNIVELLESGRRLPCPRDCPHEAGQMMKECWAADPAARPSFLSLIQRLADIRKTYDWQNNFSVSVSPTC